MTWWLSSLLIIFSPGVQAELESVVRSMANCTVSVYRQEEYADVLDAESRVANARFQQRPKIQGRASFGDQRSNGTSVDSNIYSADLSMSVLDRTTTKSIEVEELDVGVEKSLFRDRAQQAAYESFIDAIEIQKKSELIQVLSAERSTLSTLATTLKSASRIGVGESSDAMLANASRQILEATILSEELAFLKMKHRFRDRYSYRAPSIDLKEKVALDVLPPEKNDIRIKSLQSQTEKVLAEIDLEKSYVIPQLNFNAEVVSAQGAFPYEGYQFGFSVDLSGWLRGNAGVSALNAKKMVLSAKKERELRRLSNERKLLALEFEKISQHIELLEKAAVTSESAMNLAKEKLAMGRMTYRDFALFQDQVRSVKLDLSEARAVRLNLAMQTLGRKYFQSSENAPNFECKFSDPK